MGGRTVRRLLIAFLILAGCSSATTSPSTVPLITTTSTSSAPTTRAPTTVDPAFRRIAVTLDGTLRRVAVADTAELRARGLMGVTDLGDVEGMLFVFEEPRPVTFWMKDTLIPLDIAFFGDDGRLIGVSTMTPCVADPCPTYPSGAPVRWALEAAAGSLAGLTPGALLEF